MRRLKLITFDLDNTLWPVEEVIVRAERASSQFLQQRYAELAEHLSVAALHQTRDQLIQAQQHYWKNLTRLRIDTLSLALRDQGVSQTEADSAAVAAFEVFYQERNRVSFFPGTRHVLETLADSYMLGALSNGNANLELIGLHDLFEFHHSAESVGEAKPDIAIFQAALTSAGVNASDALHVGDHPSEDIEGARRAGFATIWANLLDQPWPQEIEAPSWHIRHLHEITDLLPLLDNEKMSNQRQRLRQQLHAIEAEMQRLDIWRSLPPPAKAFDNDTPFHADSMDFDNWLQWVLIARLHALLDAEAPLPSSCAITPMAEHLWQESNAQRQQLLTLLSDLDALF